MTKNRLLPNLIRICIDGYHDGNAYGKVYFTTQHNYIKFYDLAQMVIAVDNVLDLQGFPQSFQKKRSFSKNAASDTKYKYKPEVVVSAEQWNKQLGLCKTYIIMIETRYHTSWQGILYDQNYYIIKAFDNILSILHELI